VTGNQLIAYVVLLTMLALSLTWPAIKR